MRLVTEKSESGWRILHGGLDGEAIEGQVRPYGSPLAKCNIFCLSFFLCYCLSFSSFLLHCSFFNFSSFLESFFLFRKCFMIFFLSPFLCSLYFHFPFINPSLFRRYFFVVVSTSSKSVSQMPYFILFFPQLPDMRKNTVIQTRWHKEAHWESTNHCQIPLSARTLSFHEKGGPRNKIVRLDAPER